MYVVAQISDLHFNGTPGNRARVHGVLDYLTSCDGPIDALLVTGDLTDHGAAAEYREALENLVVPWPRALLLGNHDDRAEFTGVAAGAASAEPVNSALLLPGTPERPGGLLILALDSSIPGRADGELSEETLAWAAAQIRAADGAQVLLAFHHPPTTIGMPFMDDMRLFDASGLEQLIADHPNIVGVAVGHAHTAAATVFAGRPLIVGPGVASTLNLPVEDGGIINASQGPGLVFHLIDGHRMTSHFRVIDSW
ncbi:metallophosphoesterase [Gordonia sp. VNK21]|uniref:metallophosphoesterase n=1 Tax=Gordonia sp. VNK21 TaxID=3382483 RepID=UPI0038D4003C